MTEQPSHRRGFIKGIVAGVAGAFFALRGAEPVEAAVVRTPRKLRYSVANAEQRASAMVAVLAEVRPRRGSIETCWIYVSDIPYWALIEVGRTPDGDGIVNWDLAYWRESEL